MVVHRNEVHITEHEAVVVIVFQGLLKANVEQLSAIEHGVSSLIDDVDAIVELLALKDWMQIIQPVFEVLLPVTEWDNDGHLVRGDTVLGEVTAAHLYLWVLLCQKLQIHRNIKVNHHGANLGIWKDV